MSYEEVYESWFHDHLKRRVGENKRRLLEGHSHEGQLFLQKVWFPAFSQFDYLHPEFEIVDFRDGKRYLDFAYIRSPLRLAIEIDGFNTHAAGVSRWQFSDHLVRQNHLVIDEWNVLRFSYDDVRDKPRMCIQILQQFFGSRLGSALDADSSADDILEKEIIRYALQLDRPIRPIDVRQHLQIGKDRTKSLINNLIKSNRLIKHGEGTKRARCFIVNK
ncbi:DNA-binding response regulator [Paenibacillus lupini]|uniref:DNA-binding response regulator n=1 Tax=Paenibacillus lupini TaxID=1450204 RepID=UPI001FBAA8AA|nr:DNA-binding response regulator [Paenibacillus lupini]NIK22498.1 hypothetical protein [Paenibacillus lupini]